MKERAVIAFDHHTAEWVEDPYSVYRQMRDGCPVAYSEAHGGFWLLSRYEDVREALSDWQTISSNFPGRIAIPHTTPGPAPGIPIEFDPPQHTQYRSAVSTFFSPGEVKKLEPEITRLAGELIDAFIDQGECDIVRDYATPLLAYSLALFLNLSLADVAEIERWADAIFAGRLKDPEGAKRAQAALADYIGEQMSARKLNPGDDLFSTLVQMEVDGTRLTDTELLGYGRIILLAGREAVIDGLSNSLWYLAGQPEKRLRLNSEPELLRPAVEEFLRFMSPIQLLGRVATKEVELYGQTLHEGESVAMTYGSANRDERIFQEADRCLLDRKPNPHLAFGGGPHYCLGAHLARLVIRVGISCFLQRIPEFSLSTDRAAERKPNGDARGFKTLPVEF
ncbi:MAG: cytochrome P450 [Trueperaceae bacterium]|nr:MAG: cytochrome P450 [Trueperaceae bacterium]